MEISAVETTKKGRISLFVDGEFRFSVCKEVYLTNDIYPGKVITEELLTEIYDKDQLESAKEKAFTLLGYSPLSRGLLIQKLRKHFSEEASEMTADRMAELGLINDLDYAMRCAADLHHLRGYSIRHIRSELEKRFIAKEHIDEAVSSLGIDDESDHVAEIILKKHGSHLDDENKIISSLLRQGFALSDIKNGLTKAKENAENNG